MALRKSQQSLVDWGKLNGEPSLASHQLKDRRLQVKDIYRKLRSKLCQLVRTLRRLLPKERRQRRASNSQSNPPLPPS